MNWLANYSYESLPHSKRQLYCWGQDEIGTPYCVTIDFDTLEDDTVTLRNRDTTKQQRIDIAELQKELA